MSTPKSVDYLSRLPPELIEDIFDLAHDYESESPNQRLLGPPSRALKPFFDQTLHSRISLRSWYRLEKFCDRVDSENLDRIKVLEIAIELHHDWDSFSSNLEQEEPEEDVPSGFDDNSFNRILRLTDSIKVLKISGSTRLALLVLSSTVAVSSLPNLQLLSLCSTFDSFEDPFHPAHYAALSYYTSLRALHLEILRHSDSIETSRSAPILNNPSLPCLTEIRLEGPVYASASSSSLLAAAQNCSKLSLIDLHGNPRLIGLVASLSKPERLEELTVESDITSDERRPMVLSLSCCPNLRVLSVQGNIDFRQPSFYRDLELLSSLEELHFGYATALSLDHFLISTANLNLRSLVLDNLSAWSSLDFPELFEAPRRMINEDDERDQDELPVEFQGPEWTDDFRKEGFTELVRLCEAKGIELKGSTLDALRLQEQFESGELEKERMERLEAKRRKLIMEREAESE
ncbi:uncharacterized protein JCM6883_007487 [Sporobolomyces salmoneus]|uniref:uncharacterized protein n=1 Tax=Sporobolomyces salmoneus TaxID=183962 RepID=UPI00317F61BB